MAPPRPAPGKLRLAPLAEADAADIAAALDDIEVARWLSRVPHPYTRADAEAFLARNAAPDAAVFAIFDAGGLAGVIGMERELGYWLARRAWGRGYALRAARVLLARHFFDGAAPVVSGYHDGNLRSARIQQKLGFRPAGRGTVVPLATGQPTLLRRTRLTRRDWQAALGLPVPLGEVALRPLRADDAAPFRRIVTRPEVGRMLFAFPADWTKPAARAFMARWLYAGGLGFRLAIAGPKGRFVGSIGVSDAVEPDIFYFLDPALAGRGLMTRVVRGFAAYVFARFPVPALRADVFTDNPASARVLARAGFVPSGEGVGVSAQRLEPAPVWKYRLAREALGA